MAEDEDTTAVVMTCGQEIAAKAGVKVKPPPPFVEVSFKVEGVNLTDLSEKQTVEVAALNGHYEGQVPFILDMNLIFPGDGTMNFDQNVKVASIEIKCPTEKIAETASGVTFPNIQ